MPLQSNGQAFLTITCTDPNPNCRAVYRAYRRINPPWPSNSEHPQPIQINYCMFCGAPNPAVMVENNESDWIDSMAEIYHKSPAAIRELLSIYESSPPQAKLTWEKLMGAKP